MKTILFPLFTFGMGVFVFFLLKYHDLFYLLPISILLTLFILLNVEFKSKKTFYLPKVNKKLVLILAGIFLIIFLTLLITKVFKRNTVSTNTLKVKQACNENKTLKQVKQCVFPIIRDDGHGSGFSVKNNFIVTNKHVIEGATKLYTKIQNEEIELKVWNYSPSFDLAILKTTRNIAICHWYNSEQLNIAEPLYAVGWPLEYNGESTVSKGIFSRLYEYNSINYIQTDTSINPGNSGGPLVNKCGIVGINTIKIAAEGIEGMGFALPSSELINITERLIEEGSDDTEIPLTFEEKSTTSSTNYYSAPNTVRTVNIEDVRSYLNNLYSVRDSWKTSSAGYSWEDWNKLIDLFNRQIDFCETLIKRLSERTATQDDIFMWDSIVKMSYESSYLANKLLGR